MTQFFKPHCQYICFRNMCLNCRNNLNNPYFLILFGENASAYVSLETIVANINTSFPIYLQKTYVLGTH